MRIIIGCSPGSGSSLLHSLISSHSLIFGDEETHIYAKPKLIAHWNPSTIRSNSANLKSPGWHMYNGFNPRSTVVSDILPHIEHIQHKSFEAFTMDIEHQIREQYHQPHWIDKTPGNIYGFEALNAQAVNCRKIILIRNPFDTVASLISRGLTVFDAVAQCLTSMTKAALVQNLSDIHILRYENLVLHTEIEIIKLWTAWQLPNERVWDRSKEGKIKMEGWNYHEDGKVGSNSIGRYQKLPIDQQAAIANAIKQMSINPSCDAFRNISWNLLDIAEQFGYEIPDLSFTFRQSLHSQVLQDKCLRTMRLYPTHLMNYPIKLKK